MSAFIGSPGLYSRIYAGISAERYLAQQHATAKLAAAAAEWRRPQDGDDMRPAIMRGLYALNVKAVNYRYDENADDALPSPYEAAFRAGMITPHRYLKALQCLHYQMSEGTEVPAHPLYQAVEAAIAALALRIVERSPEYEAARWD